MNNFLQLTKTEQQTVLLQCKNLMGLPEQAVEKDFWVTVMLQLIFDSDLSKHIIFKGGTSLSKNGNLIERFSEDIDLAVNYTYFGLNDEPTKKTAEKVAQIIITICKGSIGKHHRQTNGTVRATRFSEHSH